MLSCLKMLLNMTWWRQDMQHFLVLDVINSYWRWLPDDQKINKEERRNHIHWYINNACRECHVLNFVTEMKPGRRKRKLYKSNTHVVLNDEVDFFLCSKVNKKCIQLSNLFLKKQVRVIVPFTNETFIDYEVARSSSSGLCAWYGARRFNNQSWINQLSPENSDLRKNTKYLA